MANTIQIKRGTGTSTLAAGELGFNTSTNTLYIGTSAGNKAIGGDGVYLPLSGGTVNGNINLYGKINIKSTYYPAFYLQPYQITNSAGTYSNLYIEGSYDGRIKLWVDADASDNSHSRRSLELLGYPETTNSANSLMLRQCDASGNWLTDLKVYHEGNIIYSASQPSNPVKGMIWLKP